MTVLDLTEILGYLVGAFATGFILGYGIYMIRRGVSSVT